MTKIIVKKMIHIRNTFKGGVTFNTKITNHLDKYIYKRSIDNHSCSICSKEYEEGMMLIKLPVCNYKHCIEQSLKEKHHTCPVCNCNVAQSIADAKIKHFFQSASRLKQKHYKKSDNDNSDNDRNDNNNDNSDDNSEKESQKVTKKRSHYAIKVIDNVFDEKGVLKSSKIQKRV